MQTTVEGQGTVTFDWKVSSEEDEEELKFYIDGAYKDGIDGDVDWEEKSFPVTGQGSHTLKWRYVTSEDGDGGCGWVDCVQWSGSPEPVPDPAKWDTITYKLVVSLSNPYDPHGRRIEKSGDSEAIKYCYDGDHVIAEYACGEPAESNGNDRLLRKYIYGARVDEPVCMIDVVDSNAVYYYHFDGLGSVVALSDSNGDSCQSYEYSVYGQVAAEDPNHPNPYMFTGRRFDIETDLYYYRARYYNQHIGRFMQTDPVGYGYGYCGNNPLGRVDPSGLAYGFLDSTHEKVKTNRRGEPLLTFAWIDENGVDAIWWGSNIDTWCTWAEQNPNFDERWFADLPDKEDRVGWDLAQRVENPGPPGTRYTKEGIFWRLQALIYLGAGGGIISQLDDSDVTIRLYHTDAYIDYEFDSGVVNWNPNLDVLYGGDRQWHETPPLALLLHELAHAADDDWGGIDSEASTERWAMFAENQARYAFFRRGYTNIFPRPGYSGHHNDLSSNSAVAWWFHIYRDHWTVRYP